jgi:hypothetical protein
VAAISRTACQSTVGLIEELQTFLYVYFGVKGGYRSKQKFFILVARQMGEAPEN